LQVSLDDNHRRIINGEIEADVSVICQRCLEPTQIQLAESFKLGLVETENHITKLPDDIDPWMVTDTKLVIADFLEEQLILAMPIVSYHSAGCQAALPPGIGSRSETDADNTRNREESPFAILKKLKEQK
jgi:uncharacterized protein